MSVSQRNLRQKTTYWAPLTRNEFGVSAYGTPVLLMGRWEAQTRQVVRPSGEEITSTTLVYLSGPVEIGGSLIEGDFTDKSSPVAGSRMVLEYRTTPDIRNADQERRAYL